MTLPSGSTMASSPAVGDRSTALATMAMFGDEFAHSKTGSGYTKLPNGLILQWGYYSNSSLPLPAGGLYSSPNQNFPIPFPTACLFICGSSTLNYVIAQAVNVSRTQFGGRFSQNTAGALNVDLSWFAIGH